MVHAKQIINPTSVSAQKSLRPHPAPFTASNTDAARRRTPPARREQEHQQWTITIKRRR